MSLIVAQAEVFIWFEIRLAIEGDFGQAYQKETYFDKFVRIHQHYVRHLCNDKLPLGQDLLSKTVEILMTFNNTSSHSSFE